MKTIKRSFVWPATMVLILLAGFGWSGQAYIDPGSGSYIFQVLIGALVGAAVALKVFWHKILAFITRGRARKG